MNSRLLDYRPDLDFLEPAPQPSHGWPQAQPLHTDMSRAAELLEVANQSDLEHFLRGLIAQTSRAGRAALNAPGGPALLAALMHAAQAILPLHRAGGPPLDAVGSAGADLHARGARIFGLELEGLSPEDKEFELAQHFIRFAADAVRRADTAVVGAAADNPPEAVQAALAQAARHHAPGLLRRAAVSGGRWQRHGDSIIVHDC